VRPLVLVLGTLFAVASGSGLARADKVFLSGGTVIEGKVTRKADKVVIEVESGEISVPAESVERIEKSASLVSRFEARYASMPPRDVKARLALADYCRDHDMRARERQLLLEVIELDPDNAAARERLGYVKTANGWVTEADAMRAKGLVQHEGRWVTRQEVMDEERLRLERETEARRRDEAQAEVHARQMQLATEQAALEAQASRLPPQPVVSVFTPYYSTFYRTPVGGFGGCVGGICGQRFRPPTAHPVPLSTSFGAWSDTSMSVVKVPYRHP